MAGLKLRRLFENVETKDEVPDIEIKGVTENVNDCENKLLILKEPGNPLSLPAVIPDGEKINGCIRVKDFREAVCRIYSNYYGNPEKRLKIIGVTGTNGKTTTAMLLSHILKKCGVRCAFSGTLSESGYTTPPPSILYKKLKDFTDGGYTHLAMEVSSHGLIQKRVSTIDFEIGILTNISRDHLDYHGNMQNYVNAKTLLFNKSKIKLLNRDSKYLSAFDFPDAYTYGIDGGDYMASHIRLNKDGAVYTLTHNGKDYEISYPVIGRFSVYNSLSAIASAHLAGVDLYDAARAALSFCGVSGRVERVENPIGNIYIDYAHTPDGIENLIKAIRPICSGRLIILIGCGGERDKGKRPLMCKAAISGADFVILTSDNPRRENPYSILYEMLKGIENEETPFAVIEDRKKAIEFGMCQLQKGDTLVLAGKGHEIYQNINGSKYPFNEREIIKKISEKLRYN